MRRLYTLVFTTGATVLGVELSASRLLEPAFGNNQIVWASLIGLILLYLAIGAWLGGRLADRSPNRRSLDLLVTLAAVSIALIPLVSNPILRMAANGLDSFALGQLLGSLTAILLLFSVPAILLGMVSPWALRLALADLHESGEIAGRIYATSTAGSIVGTFLPVLWLIPAYGTRWTFYILSLTLLVVVTIGCRDQRHRWLPILAFVLILASAILMQPASSIRAGWDNTGKTTKGKIIYEDESHYNYIAVRQWDNERHLKLNDGIGIHSIYHPDTILSLGIWDYFLLAPLFQEMPDPQTDELLLIGLAAGTVPDLFTNIYGPMKIVGIELDPQVIEVGQTYFAMNQPNLTAIAADGRHWLSQQPASAKWSMIAIDAYRPPYIPFQLTTQEFFQLVRLHLTDDGVLAINIGRTAHNFALVDALAATLSPYFASIHLIDEPGPADDLGNSLLVATVQPTTLADFAQNIAVLPDSVPVEFRDFAHAAVTNSRRWGPPSDAIIFTDDRAPVEQVIHGIIVDFLIGE